MKYTTFSFELSLLHNQAIFALTGTKKASSDYQGIRKLHFLWFISKPASSKE